MTFLREERSPGRNPLPVSASIVGAVVDAALLYILLTAGVAACPS